MIEHTLHTRGDTTAESMSCVVVTGSAQPVTVKNDGQIGRTRSSAEEHRLHTARVTGSIPVASTTLKIPTKRTRARLPGRPAVGAEECLRRGQTKECPMKQKQQKRNTICILQMLLAKRLNT